MVPVSTLFHLKGELLGVVNVCHCIEKDGGVEFAFEGFLKLIMYRAWGVEPFIETACRLGMKDFLQRACIESRELEVGRVCPKDPQHGLDIVHRLRGFCLRLGGTARQT